MLGRMIRGNARRVTHVVFDQPDRVSNAVAGSMAIATATASPMSAGAGPHGSRRGGLAGYGVNRMTSRTAPLQHFAGLVNPLAMPASVRVGIGGGVSGQPGYPSTGDATSAMSTLGMLNLRPGVI